MRYAFATTRMVRIALLVVLAAVALPLPVSAASQGITPALQASGFLTVQDNRLVLDGQVLDQPSTNMFDLIHLYLFDRPNGYRKLQEARESGFEIVRFFAGGGYSESGVNFPAIEAWENPQTRSQYFAAFDGMVADAQTLGVKLVPVLVTGASDLAEAGPTSNHPCSNSPFSIPLYPGSTNKATIKAFRPGRSSALS